LKSEYHKQELKPSADLWDRIEQKLDSNPTVIAEKPFEWMKYAAVVLLLISTGTILYFNSDTSIENSGVAKNQNPERFEQQKNIITQTPYINQKENENSIAAESEDLNSVSGEIKAMVAKEIYQAGQSDNGFQVINEEKTSENKTVVSISPVIEDKIFVSEKPVIAERKITNYIKADELLLGREFDKTREQNHNYNQNIGMLDMGQITIKSPNSFKVLGMTVFSDSVQSR